MKENCQYTIRLFPSEKKVKEDYILNLSNVFFTELFYTQLSSCPIFYDFFRERTGSQEYLFFDNTQNTAACWCALHLLWEATFTAVDDQESVQASLIVFLRDLHRTHQNHLIISESSMMKNYKFKAGSYLKYMADNYQTVTLDSIADEFGYSPAYFSTMFKKTVWVNFTEKLLELKLEHAKRLLVTTSLSIETIAIRSGFAEKSYFHRCFKQKFSLTPGEYRKLNTE
ncbi:MAG: helix-turn-helix transcriptional regulator [Treponema sp.]|nr:helix-turn-helix transcriptional regulator [Treponema sp.]